MAHELAQMPAPMRPARWRPPGRGGAVHAGQGRARAGTYPYATGGIPPVRPVPKGRPIARLSADPPPVRAFSRVVDAGAGLRPVCADGAVHYM